MCKIMFFYFNAQFCEKVKVLINAYNLIMKNLQVMLSLQFCKKILRMSSCT